jgi:hypothetical protein
MIDERERLIDEIRQVGACLMPKTGVYCQGVRLPDSAAGLCGPCSQRQRLQDALNNLSLDRKRYVCTKAAPWQPGMAWPGTEHPDAEYLGSCGDECCDRYRCPNCGKRFSVTVAD